MMTSSVVDVELGFTELGSLTQCGTCCDCVCGSPRCSCRGCCGSWPANIRTQGVLRWRRPDSYPLPYDHYHYYYRSSHQLQRHAPGQDHNAVGVKAEQKPEDDEIRRHVKQEGKEHNAGLALVISENHHRLRAVEVCYRIVKDNPISQWETLSTEHSLRLRSTSTAATKQLSNSNSSNNNNINNNTTTNSDESHAHTVLPPPCRMEVGSISHSKMALEQGSTTSLDTPSTRQFHRVFKSLELATMATKINDCSSSTLSDPCPRSPDIAVSEPWAGFLHRFDPALDDELLLSNPKHMDRTNNVTDTNQNNSRATTMTLNSTIGEHHNTIAGVEENEEDEEGKKLSHKENVQDKLDTLTLTLGITSSSQKPKRTLKEWREWHAAECSRRQQQQQQATVPSDEDGPSHLRADRSIHTNNHGGGFQLALGQKRPRESVMANGPSLENEPAEKDEVGWLCQHEEDLRADRDYSRNANHHLGYLANSNNNNNKNSEDEDEDEEDGLVLSLHWEDEDEEEKTAEVNKEGLEEKTAAMTDWSMETNGHKMEKADTDADAEEERGTLPPRTATTTTFMPASLPASAAAAAALDAASVPSGPPPAPAPAPPPRRRTLSLGLFGSGNISTTGVGASASLPPSNLLSTTTTPTTTTTSRTSSNTVVASPTTPSGKAAPRVLQWRRAPNNSTPPPATTAAATATEEEEVTVRTAGQVHATLPSGPLLQPTIHSDPCRAMLPTPLPRVLPSLSIKREKKEAEEEKGQEEEDKNTHENLEPQENNSLAANRFDKLNNNNNNHNHGDKDDADEEEDTQRAALTRSYSKRTTPPPPPLPAAPAALPAALPAAAAPSASTEKVSLESSSSPSSPCCSLLSVGLPAGLSLYLVSFRDLEKVLFLSGHEDATDSEIPLRDGAGIRDHSQTAMMMTTMTTTTGPRPDGDGEREGKRQKLEEEQQGEAYNNDGEKDSWRVVVDQIDLHFDAVGISGLSSSPSCPHTLSPPLPPQPHQHQGQQQQQQRWDTWWRTADAMTALWTGSGGNGGLLQSPRSPLGPGPPPPPTSEPADGANPRRIETPWMSSPSTNTMRMRVNGRFPYSPALCPLLTMADIHHTGGDKTQAETLDYRMNTTTTTTNNNNNNSNSSSGTATNHEEECNAKKASTALKRWAMWRLDPIFYIPVLQRVTGATNSRVTMRTTAAATTSTTPTAEKAMKGHPPPVKTSHSKNALHCQTSGCHTAVGVGVTLLAGHLPLPLSAPFAILLHRRFPALSSSSLPSHGLSTTEGSTVSTTPEARDSNRRYILFHRGRPHVDHRQYKDSSYQKGDAGWLHRVLGGDVDGVGGGWLELTMASRPGESETVPPPDPHSSQPSLPRRGRRSASCFGSLRYVLHPSIDMGCLQVLHPILSALWHRVQQVMAKRQDICGCGVAAATACAGDDDDDHDDDLPLIIVPTAVLQALSPSPHHHENDNATSSSPSSTLYSCEGTVACQERAESGFHVTSYYLMLSEALLEPLCRQGTTSLLTTSSSSSAAAAAAASDGNQRYCSNTSSIHPSPLLLSPESSRALVKVTSAMMYYQLQHTTITRKASYPSGTERQGFLSEYADTGTGCASSRDTPHPHRYSNHHHNNRDVQDDDTDLMRAFLETEMMSRVIADTMAVVALLECPLRFSLLRCSSLPSFSRSTISSTTTTTNNSNNNNNAAAAVTADNGAEGSVTVSWQVDIQGFLAEERFLLARLGDSSAPREPQQGIGSIPITHTHTTTTSTSSASCASGCTCCCYCCCCCAYLWARRGMFVLLQDPLIHRFIYCGIAASPSHRESDGPESHASDSHHGENVRVERAATAAGRAAETSNRRSHPMVHPDTVWWALHYLRCADLCHTLAVRARGRHTRGSSSSFGQASSLPLPRVSLSLLPVVVVPQDLAIKAFRQCISVTLPKRVGRLYRHPAFASVAAVMSFSTSGIHSAIVPAIICTNTTTTSAMSTTTTRMTPHHTGTAVKPSSSCGLPPPSGNKGGPQGRSSSLSGIELLLSISPLDHAGNAVTTTGPVTASPIVSTLTSNGGALSTATFLDAPLFHIQGQLRATRAQRPVWLNRDPRGSPSASSSSSSSSSFCLPQPSSYTNGVTSSASALLRVRLVVLHAHVFMNPSKSSLQAALRKLWRRCSRSCRHEEKWAAVTGEQQEEKSAPFGGCCGCCLGSTSASFASRLADMIPHIHWSVDQNTVLETALSLPAPLTAIPRQGPLPFSGTPSASSSKKRKMKRESCVGEGGDGPPALSSSSYIAAAAPVEEGRAHRGGISADPFSSSSSSSFSPGPLRVTASPSRLVVLNTAHVPAERAAEQSALLQRMMREAESLLREEPEAPEEDATGAEPEGDEAPKLGGTDSAAASAPNNNNNSHAVAVEDGGGEASLEDAKPKGRGRSAAARHSNNNSGTTGGRTRATRRRRPPTKALMIPPLRRPAVLRQLYWLTGAQDWQLAALPYSSCLQWSMFTEQRQVEQGQERPHAVNTPHHQQPQHQQQQGGPTRNQDAGGAVEEQPAPPRRRGQGRSSPAQTLGKPAQEAPPLPSPASSPVPECLLPVFQHLIQDRDGEPWSPGRAGSLWEKGNHAADDPQQQQQEHQRYRHRGGDENAVSGSLASLGIFTTTRGGRGGRRGRGGGGRGELSRSTYDPISKALNALVEREARREKQNGQPQEPEEKQQRRGRRGRKSHRNEEHLDNNHDDDEEEADNANNKKGKKYRQLERDDASSSDDDDEGRDGEKKLIVKPDIAIQVPLLLSPEVTVGGSAAAADDSSMSSDGVKYDPSVLFWNVLERAVDPLHQQLLSRVSGSAPSFSSSSSSSFSCEDEPSDEDEGDETKGKNACGTRRAEYNDNGGSHVPSSSCSAAASVCPTTSSSATRVVPLPFAFVRQGNPSTSSALSAAATTEANINVALAAASSSLLLSPTCPNPNAVIRHDERDAMAEKSPLHTKHSRHRHRPSSTSHDRAHASSSQPPSSSSSSPSAARYTVAEASTKFSAVLRVLLLQRLAWEVFQHVQQTIFLHTATTTTTTTTSRNTTNSTWWPSNDRSVAVSEENCPARGTKFGDPPRTSCAIDDAVMPQRLTTLRTGLHARLCTLHAQLTEDLLRLRMEMGGITARALDVGSAWTTTAVMETDPRDGLFTRSLPPSSCASSLAYSSCGVISKASVPYWNAFLQDLRDGVRKTSWWFDPGLAVCYRHWLNDMLQSVGDKGARSRLADNVGVVEANGAGVAVAADFIFPSHPKCVSTTALNKTRKLEKWKQRSIQQHGLSPSHAASRTGTSKCSASPLRTSSCQVATASAFCQELLSAEQWEACRRRTVAMTEVMNALLGSQEPHEHHDDHNANTATDNNNNNNNNNNNDDEGWLPLLANGRLASGRSGKSTSSSLLQLAERRMRQWHAWGGNITNTNTTTTTTTTRSSSTSSSTGEGRGGTALLSEEPVGGLVYGYERGCQPQPHESSSSSSLAVAAAARHWWQQVLFPGTRLAWKQLTALGTHRDRGDDCGRTAVSMRRTTSMTSVCGGALQVNGTPPMEEGHPATTRDRHTHSAGAVSNASTRRNHVKQEQQQEEEQNVMTMAATVEKEKENLEVETATRSAARLRLPFLSNHLSSSSSPSSSTSPSSPLRGTHALIQEREENVAHHQEHPPPPPQIPMVATATTTATSPASPTITKNDNLLPLMNDPSDLYAVPIALIPLRSRSRKVPHVKREEEEEHTVTNVVWPHGEGGNANDEGAAEPHGSAVEERKGGLKRRRRSVSGVGFGSSESDVMEQQRYIATAIELFGPVL